jgi:glutamate racemase
VIVKGYFPGYLVRVKNDSRPIGVFDSGVGGLTVAAAIRRVLPRETICYLGDLLHLPYGSKSGRAVVEFTRAAVRYLVHNDIKLLVIACNTATSLALDTVAREVGIPVLGVIRPGARAARAATRTGRVGVIGTPRTIESGAYVRALEESGEPVSVFQTATGLLVPLIEEGWFDHAVLTLVLEEYLASMRGSIDTLVLGCTHYPLIKKQIGNALPGVTVVDSAETTARETAALLKLHGLCASEGSGGCRVFLTDYTDNFRVVSERILEEPLEDVHTIALDYAEGEIGYI